jgi:hypothetical protein
MRSDAGEPHFRWDLRQSNFRRGAAERSDSAVAMAHQIAEAVMEIAGPLFWAALVVGFVTDVLRVGFLR